MELDDELALIHQPVRLRLMGLLYRQRDVTFTGTRDLLGVTDGNLATHAKRLADAGLLEARRVLTRDGFELRYRITKAGNDAFRRYLATLRGFLEQIPDAPPSS
ncbi:MAG: transcriptional regulator [Thermoplasmatota archaeon]